MPNQKSIFISYAHEQSEIASLVAFSLIKKYNVYFDKFSNRAAESWDDKIIHYVNRSDLFIYLISPDSVARNSFCRNELEIAREKWPHPEGHVLPVIVAPTEMNLIDPYIASIGIYAPDGDIARAVARKADSILTAAMNSPASRSTSSDDERDLGDGLSSIRSSDDDRHASNNIRAFIQRAEVRLSTMHRVGGAFVSGAGLIVLLPFFLRDSAIAIANLWIKSIIGIGLSWQLLTLTWFIAFLVSVYLPLLALYLLMKDLIRFYFVPHTVDEGKTLFPRYAISAISYPSSLDDNAKPKILMALYSSRIYRFGMYGDNASRQFYELVDGDKSYDYIKPIGRENFERLRSPDEPKDENERHLYNVACGIAGVSSRTLVEEAARLEASLVRHNVGLRGIVIRYAKALLLTIWTAILMLFLIAFAVPLFGEAAAFATFLRNADIVNTDVRSYEAVFFSMVFILWAFVAQRLITHPLHWLTDMAPTLSSRKQKSTIMDHDPQFKQFEIRVRRSCIVAYIACASSIISTLMNFPELVTFMKKFISTT